MYSRDEYRILYDSLSRKRKMMVLAEAKKWAGWTKMTFYRKIVCPNLPPMERMLLDGLLKGNANRQNAGQLEIQFDWSAGLFVLRSKIWSNSLTTG